MLVGMRQVQQVRPGIELKLMWFFGKVGQLLDPFAGREIEEAE